MGMRIGSRRALLGGKKSPVWKPDPLAGTFTAGMAKRATGVFAAAPIVQGMWTDDGSLSSDEVVAVRGNQISGYFYERVDPYQGSMVFWITPEWDGGDSKFHYIYSNRYVSLYKHENNRLYLFLSFNPTISHYVSTAGWTAGTTYSVVIRWDTKNTLDGTNYICISVNNSHDFGRVTGTAVDNSYANLFIGLNWGATSYAADSIIEGLTVYRRPLWDGANGIDVGNGDEVNLIYNGGSGQDTCLVTGSWDVVFCLPTDATAGALVTGTGEAWSHPHSSAALTDTFCETTYGTSGWGTEGTPSAGPADITAAQRIFQWGYEWTCDAANEGITQTIACAAGADYVLRVIAHCTSANDIRVRIWDETNGAQIGADFDFGASSSRTAPGVALFCFEAPTIARNGVGADCISISIKVMGVANTQVVYVHQVELQANLLDNPSLETGAGNPWIPDGWTNNGLDAGDTEAEAATVHSGVGSVEWNPGAILGEGQYETITTTIGKFLSFGGWTYGDGSDGFRVGAVAAARALLQYSLTAYNLTTGTGASWAHFSSVLRALHANPRLQIEADAIGGDGFTDDFYAVELDDVALTVTPASEANSAEGNGIRVDGDDTLTLAIPANKIGAKAGDARWVTAVRHDVADVVDLGNATPYELVLWGDANNYIALYWLANQQLVLAINAGGAGVQSGTVFFGASYFTPGVEEAWRILWSASWIRLYFRDAIRLALPVPTGFTTLPATAYFGSDENGLQQVDSVFSQA